MQEGESGARTNSRRGQRVARRLFQDQDQDHDQDQERNRDRERDRDDSHRQNNSFEGSSANRPYAAVEDNLTNRLSEEARQDVAKAEMRWNFDFVNERPLPGRWQWVKVGGTENEGENHFDNETEDQETDQRDKSETEANEKAN